MKECIILAGGLGTRLQSVISDVPKCMAMVDGKPFLEYLFHYLIKENISHVILALGYKSEIVIAWIDTLQLPLQISYVIEENPLGTGGAIALACGKVQSDKTFVINGDTYFDVNLRQLEDFHTQHMADLSIALKPMLNFDRYGSVLVDDTEKITMFDEKKQTQEGLINGGIYLMQKNIFDTLNLPPTFSFEKDIMEVLVKTLKIYGCQQDGYFIDIGIPSDFEKANEDFKSLIF